MVQKNKRVKTFVSDGDARFEDYLNEFLTTVIDPKITYTSNSIVYEERIVTVITAFVEYEDYQ